MLKATIEMDRNNAVTLKRLIEEVLAEFERRPDRKRATFEVCGTEVRINNVGKTYNRKKDDTATDSDESTNYFGN